MLGWLLSLLITIAMFGVLAASAYWTVRWMNRLPLIVRARGGVERFSIRLDKLLQPVTETCKVVTAVIGTLILFGAGLLVAVALLMWASRIVFGG